MSTESCQNEFLTDIRNKDASTICEKFSSMQLKSQINCLEKIRQLFMEDNSGQARNVILGLLYCLLNSQPRDHLRAKIIKLLVFASEHLPAIYASCIEDFLDMKLKLDNSQELHEVIGLICTNEELFCMKISFPDEEKLMQIVGSFIPRLFAVSKELFEFQWNLFLCEDLTSVERNQNLLRFESLLKNITVIVQRHSGLLNVDLKAHISKLCLQLCNNEGVPVDLRSNCGMLTVILHSDRFSSADDIVREIMDENGCFERANCYCRVALFHGVLCVYPISEAPSTGSACLRIFSQLLTYLRENCHQVLILSSRILNHLVNKLVELAKSKGVNWHEYKFSSDFSTKLMNCLYMLWDNYIDIVKHLTRETFSAFMKLQLLIDDGAGTKMQEMAVELFNQEPLKKYVLSAMVYFIPGICVDKLIEEAEEHALARLVNRLKDPALAPTAANLIQALFEAHSRESNFDEWSATWLPTLLNNYDKQMLTYGYERLLFKFMSCKLGAVTLAIEMLLSSPKLSVNEQNLIVMCAKIKVLLKAEPKYLTEPSIAMWKGAVPYNILKDILLSADACGRILAFNLICESSKSTELFCDIELELILLFIQNNTANQAADFRQKVVNNCKKQLNRVSAGLKTKNKLGKTSNNACELKQTVSKYEHFVRKLFQLVVSDIGLDNSFARRTTAFHILETIFDTVLAEGNYFHYLLPSLCSLSYTETLLMNLIDSYEVNKIIIMKLFKISLPHCRPNGEFFQLVLNDAWKLASSFKPNHTLVSCFVMASIVNVDELLFTSHSPCSRSSNTLSLCWQILERLKAELDVANRSILEAAGNSPMYGLLVVLRVIILNIDKNDLIADILSWSELIKEIIETCSCVVAAVEPVVNNNSPEGFLPIDFCRQNVGTVRRILKNALALKYGEDEIECFDHLNEDVLVKGQAITSQILLVCGWRSIKESCLLMGRVVKLLEFVPPNTVLSVEQIDTIGKLFLHLMINTKHRGAFEQANVAFNDICKVLWHSEHEGVARMPEVWRMETLAALLDYKNPRLCATRRSAGLPFIIQSILATEPNARADKSLQMTMKFLFQFALEPEVERRVHSMNIMRALFRETRLSESIMTYACDGVKIALRGYKSKSWCERNAATLMLAALINKIIGVKKTRDARCKSSISSVAFFTSFPDLCDLFLDELQVCQDEMNQGKITVATYPVLLVVSRLGQAFYEGKYLQVLHKFAFLIIKCSSSPIYHLRFLASRALIPFFTPANESQIMQELFRSASLSNQNKLHGVLLCLKEIVTLDSIDISKRYAMEFCLLMWTIHSSNKCFVTKAAAIELYTLLVKKGVLNDEEHIHSIESCCYSVLKNVNITEQQHCPEIFKLIEVAAAFLWQIATEEFLFFVLNLSSEEVAEICFDTCNWPGLSFHLGKIYPKLLTCKSASFRTILYSTLERELSRTQYYASLENVEAALELYSLCLSDLRLDFNETLISSVIILSGHLLKYIIEEEHKKSEMCDVFLNSLSKFCDSQYSTDVRLSLSNSLKIVSSFWRRYAKQTSCIFYVELLVDLLLADETEVQDAAAVAAVRFLDKPNNCRLIGDNTHPKEDVIASLMNYLGNLSTPSSLAMLSRIALKEDEAEEFGLSEDKDRAFEKGETNLLREQTKLSEICAVALCTSISNQSEPLIDSSCLKELLSTENTTSTVISMRQYGIHLRTDIELMLNKMQVLLTSTPLTFPNFIFSCTRLSSRALIYDALRRANVPVETVSDSCLNIIRNSVMKPIVFCDILKMLDK